MNYEDAKAKVLRHLRQKKRNRPSFNFSRERYELAASAWSDHAAAFHSPAGVLNLPQGINHVEGEISMAWNTYSELSIGEKSKQKLFANLCAACGFEYAGPDTIQGLSGLKHRFEAVGARGKNLLLIAGGAEDRGQRKGQGRSPRERMEAWRDAALLASYDVQNALQANGNITDLMFFHNINSRVPLPLSRKKDPGDWIREHGLDEDVQMSETYSVDPLETVANRELATVAESVGASFLSLDDLSIDEIAQLTRQANRESVRIAEEILRRLRLYQYFSPPTDELLVTSYDLSRDTNQSLAPKIYEMSVNLGHHPSNNVLVPDVDFKDPVATAIALEKHRYIEYQRTVEITPEGKKITETIRKTAQGSFVIRLLRNIGLGDLAKAIVEGLGKNG